MTVTPPRPSPAYFQRIPKREVAPARARRGSTASRHPLLLVPSAERDARRSRAVAKQGQQGEPGPDRTPQAREVADGVVFTRRFRRSGPGSSITHGLAQGQQAAGCRARPRHAPVRSPQGLLCRECRARRPSRRPVWPWTAGAGRPWSRGGSGAWTPGRQEEKSRARFPRNRGAVKGWRQDEVASRGQRAAEKPLFRRRWQCHV